MLISTLVVTPLLIVLLVFTNDFVTMSIATDHVSFSKRPESLAHQIGGQGTVYLMRERGHGEVGVFLSVDGLVANTVRINIK